MKALCNNGHQLWGSNLGATAYNTKQYCRACRLAREWAHRNGFEITDPRVKTYADERYRKYLLKDGVPIPPPVDDVKASTGPTSVDRFNTAPLRAIAKNKETCERGHKLIEPNVSKTRRTCQSCRLAFMWAKRHNKFNDDPLVIEWANAKYREIMGEADSKGGES